MKESPPRYGVQAVRRALQLLTLIELRHERGVLLGELVERSGLDRTTVYRLVSTLVEGGLVRRDADKRYSLGIASMQLGLTAMSRVPLLDAISPTMIALAKRTGYTVYLAVRNGDYTHTLHKEEGATPAKALETVVGALRLIGIGTGGQALLGTLDDEHIRALHRRHADRFERRSITVHKLLAIARSVRTTGYANTSGVLIPEVGGVGVAFQSTGDTYAAISIAALRQNFPAARREWVFHLICEELRSHGFEPFHHHSTSHVRRIS